jgi:hypothetical protein
LRSVRCVQRCLFVEFVESSVVEDGRPYKTQLHDRENTVRNKQRVHIFLSKIGINIIRVVFLAVV